MIRRQQILRRAGYAVRVDGVWGTRSQRLWQEWWRGIDAEAAHLRLAAESSRPAMPHGFIYRDGVPVPARRARVQDALDGARRAMRAYDAGRVQGVKAIQEQQRRRAADQAVLDLVHHDPAIRRGLGNHAALYAKAARSAHPSLVLQRAHQSALRAQARRLGRDELMASERNQLSAIFGGFDLHIWARPQAVEKAAREGRITPQGLALLVRDGFIDPSDHSDVRAVQIVANQRLEPSHHVKVDGVYGEATNLALGRLFARAAADEYAHQVGLIRSQLFSGDGVGKIAAIEVLGHEISPGRMLAILQAGGPKADELMRVVAREQADLRSMRDLRAGREDWARAVLAKHGVYVGSLSNKQLQTAYTVSGKLGAIWATSRDTRELARRLNALRHERNRAAAAPGGDPGFWADVTGPILDGFGEIGDALSATGIPGLLGDGYSWAKTESQRAVLTAGAIWNPGNIQARGGHVGSAMTLNEAWEQSRFTLDDLHRAGGWRSFVFDAVVDPVNIIPFGLVAHGGGLALRGLAGQGVRSIDLLERVAGPQMSARFHEALIVARSDAALIHDEGFKAFARTYYGRGYWSALGLQVFGREVWPRAERVASELRVLKSERIRAVNRALNLALSVHLRSVTSSKLLQEAGVSHEYTADLAARIAQSRAAVGPELTRAISESHDHYEAALRDVAPAFVDSLLAVPTSLYADLSQESGLSFAGRRVEAFLLEQASRSILLRHGMLRDLADVELDEITAATVGERSLESLRDLHAEHVGAARQGELMEEAGSWYAGAVPHDLADAYQAELELFSKRLRDQVLPALEGLLHARHGLSVWTVAAEGARLTDEAGAAVREALDDFFGYSVEEGFSDASLVTITNPNYDVALTDSEMRRVVDAELGRRESSLMSWVALRERLDGTDLSGWAIGQLVTIREEVEAAFVRGADGLWRDTRETLLVPAPSARALDLSSGSPAHGDAIRLVEAVTDAQHIPREKVDALRAAAARNLLDATVTGEVPVESWQRFVDEAGRLEALHALAADKLLPSAYRREWMLWDAMREANTWPVRSTYHAIEGMTAAWRFSVLKMRPATWVKNAIDNLSKILLSGMRDPRLFWLASGGQAATKSFAELIPIPLVLHTAAMFDRMFGSAVAPRLRSLIDDFWAQAPRTLEQFFRLHGIPYPRDMFTSSQTLAGQYGRKASAERIELGEQSIGDVRRAIARRDLDETSDVARFKDRVFGWIFEAALVEPEMAARKAAYADTFLKRARELGGDEWQALREALDASDAAQAATLEAIKVDAMAAARAQVDHVLFDYDKITTLDELLRGLLPFGFYSRRNVQYWATAAIERPWFFVRAGHALNEAQSSQVDQPVWARRYVSLSPLAAVTDEVPGLGWLSGWLRDGTRFDPVSFASVSQLYTFWKTSNPILPADEQGWPYVGNLVDAISGLGLGVNPVLRYLGGRLGVLNRRAWMDAFPQTSVIQALTSPDVIRKHLLGVPGVSEEGLNVESMLADPVFALLGGESDTAFRDASFASYVNREIAAQIERGEKPDRARAEAKIRGYLMFATLSGFVVGAYPRRITDDDLRLYTIGEQLGEGRIDFVSDLDERQREAYRLFKATTGGRELSAAAFDRYRRGLEAAAPFYAMDSWEERQAYLRDHPEILPIVEPDVDKRIPLEIELRTQSLIERTDLTMALTGKFLHGIDAAPDVIQAAESVLVTPSLKAFWRSTRTPAERRMRHLRGMWAHHVALVNDGYYSIPEGDIEARQGYLDRHPELRQVWAADDSAADDYRAVIESMNGAFRSVYFGFVERGDWASADRWLAEHPFVFEWTSAEGRVSASGQWASKSQAQREYAAVADKLRTWSRLSGWVADQFLDSEPLVRRFLQKWGAPGGVYQHALDYERVRAHLRAYFSLPASKRDAFVQGTPDLKGYLATYARDRAMSQHARDYLAVKAELDEYFSLPESERSEWLRHHPDVRAYFNRYADHGGGGVGYHSALRSVLAEDPAIASRVEFWHRYLALDPSERQRFLYRHGEDYGVFVYGSLSYDARHRREERWEREGIARGLSPHAAAYSYVAPLLTIFFSLPKGAMRTLFLSVNPELSDYLRQWARPDELIADPKLAQLVEEYSRLQPYSQERRDFIDAHPELERYFSEHQTVAERAIRRMVDAYFQLPFGPAREEYIARNPELKAYFDRRQAEHQRYSDLAAAWNDADPRFEVFSARYADIIDLDAVKRFELAAAAAPVVHQGGARTDREPATSTPTLAARRGRVPS